MMQMIIPPINHTCCGTPCFQEYEDQENYPCWGDISCVSSDFVDDGESYGEYRYGACEGHSDMYPTYDKSLYNRYEKKE